MGTSDLFVFAGEASGDLHGSRLLKELYTLNPNLKVCGVGGPKMRSQPFECVMQTEEFQVMGFSDVLLSLPKLVRHFYMIRNYILKKQPKAVIFIDYPGFNLRMAKSLRKKGFKNKLVHYIAPTVWAWGKKRIAHMAKTLDLLLTIFPFESESFNQTTLPVQYVGNPLMAELNKPSLQTDWKKQFSMPDHFFALFPGSREGEITRNLPLQLHAAKQMKMPFAISCAHPSLKPLICKIIDQFKLENFYLIPENYTCNLMQDAAFAISKSGTATLELALHGCPTVVTYQLSRLNYFLAKYIFKINLPHYCIANILLQETLFPEMIGLHLNPSCLVNHARNLQHKKEHTQQAANRLKLILTEKNASLNAAKAIHDLL